MKKWRIEYRDKYTPTPMSFWVHRHLDQEVWIYSEEFEPSLPKPIPCKGYPMLIVNALGIELVFASIEEAEHFLNVISQKNMPTSQQLARQRIDNYGPNTHWLSRLPSGLKPRRKREKIIPLIKAGLDDLKAVYTD